MKIKTSNSKNRIELLTKEQKKLEKEILDITQTLSDTQKHQARLKADLASVTNQLNSLKVSHLPKLLLSDHAVLRYAERHYQFPVDKIRTEMEDKLKGAADLGSVQFMGFVVKGQTVVTYLPTEADHKTVEALTLRENPT